jgi:hypothetical protein
MAADSGSNLEPGSGESFGNDAGRAHLLTGDLRVAVQVPPNLDQLGTPLVDVRRENGQRFTPGFLPQGRGGECRQRDRDE